MRESVTYLHNDALRRVVHVAFYGDTRLGRIIYQTRLVGERACWEIERMGIAIEPEVPSCEAVGVLTNRELQRLARRFESIPLLGVGVKTGSDMEIEWSYPVVVRNPGRGEPISAWLMPGESLAARATNGCLVVVRDETLLPDKRSIGQKIAQATR